MKALRKLTWIEFKLFLRDPLSMVFTLLLPFFFLVVLNGVFGNEPELDPEEDVWLGVGPADYYVPAYIGLVMAAIGVLSLPVRLATYRELGVLRRFRASSMPLWAVLTGQIIITLAVAVVGGVSITLASAIIYGTHFPDSYSPLRSGVWPECSEFCGARRVSGIGSANGAIGAGRRADALLRHVPS